LAKKKKKGNIIQLRVELRVDSRRLGKVNRNGSKGAAKNGMGKKKKERDDAVSPAGKS